MQTGNFHEIVGLHLLYLRLIVKDIYLMVNNRSIRPTKSETTKSDQKRVKVPRCVDGLS